MPLSSRLLVKTLTTSRSKDVYTCNTCAKSIKSTNGYTNVIYHLKRFHPSYEEDAATALRDPNLLSLRLVAPRTTDIFRWIDWIVTDFLPLSFCEQPQTRLNTKLSRISVQTLKKYMDGLVEHVTSRVASSLPSTFGIVLDGWTSGGTHFVAIFAVFNDPAMDPPTVATSDDYHEGLDCHTRRFVLLAFQPMEDEGDLSAQSLFDLIADTLSRYEQPWESVAFMVGDNCAVNQCIGRREGAIPLIGCASNRFALAVRDFLESDSAVIDKVHALMKRLSTIKGRAALLQVTSLCPVSRNDTRWSSIYAMLSRFVEIKDDLVRMDLVTARGIGLDSVLLDEDDADRVDELLLILDNFERVTKTLQKWTLTMSAVRRLFDHAIKQYPQMRPRLGSLSSLVTFPAFETGLVKIQQKEALSQVERTACAAFKRSAEEGTADSEGEDSFVAAAFKRRNVTKKAAYVDVSYVPPTSNECERLFSRAKLVFSDLRKSMDRVTLETLLFLHSNRHLWNVYDVEAVRASLGERDFPPFSYNLIFSSPEAKHGTLGSANDGGLKGVLDDLKRLVETHDGDSRLREYFPVRDAVCKLVIDNVQSCIPSEAVGLGPACEVGHLAPTNVQCGASPSLVVHVVKMIKDADDDRKYVAVDRVLRGSLTSHQRVGVIVSSEKLPPSIVDQHNAIKPAFPPRIPVSAPYLDSTLERTMVSIGQVGSLDGNRFMEAPDGVTTGSVCAICGLDDDLLCFHGRESPRPLYLLFKGVLRQPRRHDGSAYPPPATTAHRVHQGNVDPVAPYQVDEIVPCYRETVTTVSSKTCMSKSPNRHVRIYCRANTMHSSVPVIVMNRPSDDDTNCELHDTTSRLRSSVLSHGHRGGSAVRGSAGQRPVQSHRRVPWRCAGASLEYSSSDAGDTQSDRSQLVDGITTADEALGRDGNQMQQRLP